MLGFSLAKKLGAVYLGLIVLEDTNACDEFKVRPHRDMCHMMFCHMMYVLGGDT